MNFVSYDSWINEKFTEDSDPVADIGIGVKHLIEAWIKKYCNRLYYKTTKFVINTDFSVDVLGNLVINGEDDLIEFPSYITFNVVDGIGWINYNKNLKTLKGGPKYVKQWFCCNNNNLTSLRYAPKQVDNDFMCGGNKKFFSERYVRKFCNVKGCVENKDIKK